MEQGARARLDAATQWREHVERQVTIDFDDITRVGDGMGGERGLVEKTGGQWFAARMYGAGPVGTPCTHVVLHEGPAVSRNAGIAALADPAGTECQDHVVARLCFRD